ncbi:DUF5979 domain-containing protein [Microbacterium mangrovi]|nr:DUF5979 domain-containing protein [Microbacterium mangrovi]
MTPPQSASAALAQDAAFGITKSVVGNQTTFQPGDTFQYRITVSCSSTTTGGCINATVADELPAPLVLNPAANPQVTASLSPAGPVDVAYAGTTGFTVTPNETWTYNGASKTGMIAGHQLVITVSVKVPNDVPGTYNGQKITNTAVANADNAPSKNATADVTLSVPTTLAAGISKNASVSTIPAVPGKPVDWTVSPTNNSNQNVDTIVVQDPVDLAHPPTNLQYLDFTGADVTPPPTTTSTDIEYSVNGVWTTTKPVAPDTADGVRVTFHGTYAPGASGDIVVHSVTNDQVTGIPDGQTVSIRNDASAVVQNNGASSDPATDSATVHLSANAPDVSITKSFDDTTLLSGQSATASVKATVGAQDVESLTINEPTDGEPGFAEQGVTFTGFGAGLAWPVAATKATITYDYTDCASTTASTTTKDTLPDPQSGCTVDGFSVTYESPGTDGIQSGSYALLPIQITANTVITKKSSTNFVDTAVTNTDGQSGTADTKASFTISPLTVDTQVTKKITPTQIYGEPGTTATISLTGKVSDDSTVGSNYLIISDPSNPRTDSSGFWDQFTADYVQTDVPNCSVLTVNYFSKSEGTFEPLPGAQNIAGPQQNLKVTVPSDIQDDIGGIQFIFTPSTAAGCPKVLPPGFNVTPSIGVETTQTNDAPISVDNGVCSKVANPSAVRSPQTDCAEASIDIVPLEGGNGPQFVNKAWTQPSVPSLTGDDRTTRIGWSTQGLKLKSMAITDPSTQGELDDVATSVFDAWNLKRIEPITPADDPLIAQDVISQVSLYENGAWVDVTAAACANGCTGQFGGYTLSGAEQTTATGVRFVYSERTPGAGIGSSYGFDRPLNLTWTLRDTLRSNPSQYVLGTLHPYTYNSGQQGVVDNTVAATGTTPAGSDFTSTAHDEITILDSPVNVDIAKTFDQTQLGLPQEGTAQSDYPLISSTITATNDTAGNISSMVITDPSPGQADPTAFDSLNLYSIDTITPPPGATANDTIVTLTGGPNAGTYTLAAAEALTPTQLATVTGIEVAFGTPTGSPIIVTKAQGVLGLTWQLRATYRTSGDPMQPTAGNAVDNEAHVQVDSPARIPCTDNPSEFCSSGTDDATASFNIVDANYTVATFKGINPTSMYEDVTPPNYTSTLISQPNGNARTVLMTTTDDTPTFWNTMDYTGSRMIVPAPINQVRMDVLVSDPAGGKTITWNVVAGKLVASCNGTPVTQTAACWTTGEWIDTTPGSTVTFALPAGVTAAQVVGLRYGARELVDGAPVQWEKPYNPRITYSLSTTRREYTRSDPTLLVGTDRPDLQPNPGETDRGVISNTVRTHGDAQFGPNQTFTDDAAATATTLVKHLVNSIKVTKTRGSAGLLDANGSIPYVFTVKNTGQWDMTGLTVTDQITPLVDGQSPVIEPTPAAYTFTLTGPNGETGDTTGFAAHLDEATGVITVTTPADFVFLHGWTLKVNAPLLFRPGLDPNTVIHNTVTTTSDRLFETCQSTSTDLQPKPDTHNVADCAADTTVAPAASSVVSMKKWVKGDEAGDPNASPVPDDLGVLNVSNTGSAACSKLEAKVFQDGYYTYPCAPITRPGGEETWKLEFTNSGNANARVIAAVDTLPAVGDQGVIVHSGRGSQFAVSLVGKVFANLDPGATLTSFFSTKVLSQDCNENAIRVYTDKTAADPACDFGWTPFDASTPESALTGARSVQFVVTYPDDPGTAGLAPGDTLAIRFDTRTPSVLPKESAVPSGQPVAYNSFAAASRTVATVSQDEHGELPAEPQRVGVATATGQLQMKKIVDAPDFSSPIDLPTSYPMLVTCTSDDQPVTLVFADGSDASRPSVPADGSVFVYDNTTGPVNLPLFAQCTMIEDPKVPGVTVKIDPDTALTADRDLSTNDQVNHPYVGTPDESRFTVTNTYTAGGFTVSKAVDNGGAVNQDGTPIVYDRTYTFTASCTYLGQEAVPVADRTFTLHDGDSKAFTGIPTGAECTVTETGNGGAGSTDITLTTGGDTSKTTGSSTQFTVGDGDATITTAAFTNRYTVGSVAIHKVIDGDGADPWGAGPFTFRTVCTLDGVTPTTTVYDDTFTLTPPDDLTKTIDDLPTGASCTTTETVAGGATAHEVTPQSVTVGDGDTQTFTATNTFRLGGLDVHKVRDGAGADAWGTGPYTVSLTCTFNGKTIPAADIPGGATRTLALVGNWTASYSGLPVGAKCWLAETDQGFATTTAITDAAGHPVDADHPVTITDDEQPLQLTVTNTFDVGRIRVDKIVTGGSANLHENDTFEVTAACTYDGKPIDVPGGAVRELHVGTPVVYDDLPVGAECTITETGNSGANDVTFTPADPDNPDQAVVPVTENGETAHVLVDNVYTVGGFTVTKKVASDAVNQDGDPIFYDQKFTFHATCTYRDESMLDETFRLMDGQSESFDDLPTGADCTVAEIGTGGAGSTTVVLTQQGKPEVSGDGSVDFSIGTGDASITTARFTNHMTVGSLQLQKVVDGDGAKLWGAGPFTMHVACVLLGADPNVVYDGDVVLGGENPLTATIPNLPTRAECHVKETDAAGAQASTVDPKLVTIGDGTTVTVTATNTFTVGQIVVTKKVAGDGASDHTGDTFKISLMCVWNGVQIDIPGGDERTLTVAQPVTYSGLPTGADCTVTETDAAGAAGVSMTPASPDNPQTASVVVGDGTEVQVVVTNTFDATPVLPVTGGDATVWLIAGGIGLVLIGGGTVLLITTRRRRRA